MAATTTTEAVENAPVVVEAPAQVGATVRVMAMGLWVVVGSLLCYGTTMTVIKAAALFG